MGLRDGRDGRDGKDGRDGRDGRDCSQLGFADLAPSRAPRDAVMPRVAGSKYARHSEVGRDRSKATVIIRRVRGKQPPKVGKAAQKKMRLAENVGHVRGAAAEAARCAESALMAAAEVESLRAAAATREQAWRRYKKRWEAWEEEQAKLSCMARERVAATMKKLLGSP